MRKRVKTAGTASSGRRTPRRPESGPEGGFVLPGEGAKSPPAKQKTRPRMSGHHASDRLKADIRVTSQREPGRYGRPSSSALAPKGKNSRIADLSEAGRSLARSRSVSVVSALFFCFVLIYMVRFIVAFATKQAVKVEKVNYGSVDVPQVITGVIIRDEKVYRSPASGTVSFQVPNLSRVKKGSPVCSVENTQEIEKVLPDLDKIDEQLLKIQEQREYLGYNSEQKSINSQIKSMVDNQIISFAKGDMANAYSLKDSVSRSIEARNNLILSSGGGSSLALGEQRKAIQSLIAENTTSVAAEESGIISCVLDGFEETHTFSSLGSLTRDEVEIKADYSRLSSVRQAQSEDALFKIVASNAWYIAAYIPNVLLEGWEEGDRRTIYLSEQDAFNPLPVTVDRLQDEGGQSLAVFKSTRNILDYLSQRTVELKTVDSVKTGLKISESSIAEKALIGIPEDFVFFQDTKTTINVVGKGEVEISPVYTDSGSVYAESGSGFALGDVVSDGDGGTWALSETAIAKGVYRINYGTAEFRRIVLDESQKSGSYYILEPSLNKAIQAYDWIASNASEVVEDQIIY